MIPPPMMMTSQVFTDCIVKGVEPRVRPLQLAQEINNFRLLPIHRPDELAAQHAIAIDDVSLGKLERAIEIIALSLWVAHHEQIDIVVFQKFVDENAYRKHIHSLIL